MTVTTQEQFVGLIQGFVDSLQAISTEATLASLVGVRDTPALADQHGIAALAMRGDSDTVTVADGELSFLRVDEEGRVKVATKPASIPAVVGVANTVASTVVCDVRRASNVVFHVKNAGTVTLAAGTFVFEGSLDSTNGTDGTWFGIQAVRSNANTVETQIALAGMAVNAGYAASWEASANGYSWLRLRCSVAVTANASAQWTIQRGSYATEPIPAAQATGTQGVSGTVTVTLPTGTAYAFSSAATTNAAVIKATAGSMFGISVSNPTATPAYLKLYNKTTAPVVGTDVPVLTAPVPAIGVANLEFGAIGKRFALGIGVAITGAAAATDTTATVAGLQVHATYI